MQHAGQWRRAAFGPQRRGGPPPERVLAGQLGVVRGRGAVVQPALGAAPRVVQRRGGRVAGAGQGARAVAQAVQGGADRGGRLL